MISWILENLSSDTRIASSNSDFTFDKKAIKYLKHYIQHSYAESDFEWRLLHMNYHESRFTSEFITLVNDNHIRSLTLISHFIHFMQSLNIDVFQAYKRWHSKVIMKIVSQSFIKYLTHFLNDLIKIRNNTFKKNSIRHAFEKTDM
jgi:hypothetical protein